MTYVDHLIVGTGFSGIAMAVKLKESGINDFVVIEKADSIGGAWRENHYPGCACDVQSHLYSYSFNPNSNWSRMYAPQREIKDYITDTAKKFGVFTIAGSHKEHIRLANRLFKLLFLTQLYTICT